ncbi:TonB-dependent receptor [Sphingobacterium sp. SGG-5]|uniref:TonB-dependent receptor plug domain-containing protein n=1 Tax=Sphingobacterium sp. SGG-5 TaxID=2710881 RepID=UPI0013ED2516|nr:TonB-dependent receptor [Sphingobacterium sp. SGG-5]NGM61812.1 TonB-dependent receptor [Sphingobacterium sp. SGG-5]
MGRKLFFLSVFAIPFVGLAQLRSSDTTAISEIVVSENRLQIPFSKTSRNIQVITKQEIQQLSVRSINEALAFIGGVDIRQRGPFGTQTDVGIDGGSFEQTLILLNGVKISDAQTAHHSMNIPVPLDAVERIEVLRGPAARIYGVNALTGAINIITTTQESNSFSVHTQVGSALEGKEAGDGSGMYGGGSLQLVAHVGHTSFQNLLTVSQDLSNGQRYNTASSNRRAFYQANLDLDERNSVTWMGGGIHNTFGANGYYAAPYDVESQEIVNTSIASVGSSHQFGERFVLKPRVSYRYNEDDFRLYRDDLSKGRSEHSTNAFSAELNSTLYSSIGDFGFGLETRSEKIESTNMGDHHRDNHGAYVEYSTDALRNVLLNVGAYVNYNTDYGWQAFPGIDIAYLFHPSWKLALNIGSSQRIPSFTDLYLDQGTNVGNRDLKSENAWQYEASLQYHVGNLRVQTGYFYRNIAEYIDWIREDAADPYQPQNFGENRVQGFHMSVGQHFKINEQSVFSYEGSYHYLAPKDLTYADGVTSKYILESLKHQAILRLAYQQGVWHISSGNRFVKRELKNSYFLTDIRVAHRHKGLNLYADVTNVFNQSYIETAAVPLPGRWFSLGIQYTL